MASDAAADNRVRVILFLSKRSDITFDEFKEHYETKHIPLMQSLASEDWPIFHKRQYITSSNMLIGTAEDLPYDAISELEFEDQAHFQRFSEIMYSGDVKRQREEDESKFVDITKMKGIWQMDERITKRA